MNFFRPLEVDAVDAMPCFANFDRSLADQEKKVRGHAQITASCFSVGGRLT